MKRFIDDPNQESDYDVRYYVRTFSGRMTKLRWEIIDRYCRKNCARMHCGHEWDCCGCLCGTGMSFTYKHNQVTVYYSQSFNY